MANKTMIQASEEAEAKTEEVGKTSEVTEEVQSETSELQQDQVTTGKEEAQSEGVSEEVPATATTDFDPIAFLDSLEVENLTPENKQALKDGYLRQADYTKKTQALATDRNEINEYRTLKPYIERIFQDENLYSAVFGNNNPQNNTANVTDIPDDPEEYANWLEQRSVNKAVEMMREENMQRDIEYAMEADRNQASQLDPRLSTDPDFAYEIGGIVAMNQAFINGEISATQATAEALETQKQRENRYKTKVTQDFQNKAKNKTMVFPQTRGTNSTSSSTPARPSSMAEAAEMAEKQINN